MESQKYSDIKITILKKLKVNDIFVEYAKENMPLVCAKGEVGDEFISNCEMPEQFCKGAWTGLKSKVEF